MADKPGNQIAIRRGSDLSALDDLDSILLGGDFNVEVIDDPELISKQMIAEILAAENDDEAELTGSAQGWAELEGIPIEIRDFRWRRSDFENSDIYVVVFGTRMDFGENVILTTGSLNVVAQLSNLARRGRLPAVRILTRADKPTKSGFYPMQLVSTPEEIERRRQERLSNYTDAAE